MRIVIKNADFSSVSIGKVVEDLSRDYALPLYDTTNGKWNSVPNDFFMNATPNGSTVALSDYYPYSLSNGVVIQSDTTTSARAVTNFIKVVPGMTITCSSTSSWSAASNIVRIACFDEDYNLIPSSYEYTETSPLNYTVPQGVKYVKLQLQPGALTVYNSAHLRFTMPE